MTVEQMAEAIGRAHGAALDGLARALWSAVAHGKCSDEDAARLVEAIQARRADGPKTRGIGFLAKSSGNLPAGQVLSPPNPGSAKGMGIFTIPSRRHQRPPIRSEAIERRRRLAASGPMPPALAARFTTGELAVLRIVADEHQARQVCALCLDAIAARAGVSRTLAKGAIRQARRLGMLEVRERRRTGAKSLPNLVRVIDRDWLAWMKRGQRLKSQPQRDGSKSGSICIGGRNPTTTDKLIIQGRRSRAETAQEAVERGEARRKGCR